MGPDGEEVPHAVVLEVDVAVAAAMLPVCARLRRVSNMLISQRLHPMPRCKLSMP